MANKDNILAVTSPCFELWLLLHFRNSVNDYIKYNSEKIFLNKRVSNKHTFMSKLFSDVSGMNPKTNIKFEELKEKIDVAIEQEKELFRDIKDMANNIGSNIGVLIEKLREDPREKII